MIRFWQMDGAGRAGAGTRLAAVLPAAAPVADINVGGELLRVLFSLVAVVALIFVAGWMSRRLQARSRPGGRRIRCVEAMALGARDRVLLIEADGKRLLIGVGPGGMRTLHVYEGEAPMEDDPAALPAVPDLAQLLSRWRGKS